MEGKSKNFPNVKVHGRLGQGQWGVHNLCSILRSVFTSEDHGQDPVYSPSIDQEQMQTVLGKWVFIQLSQDSFR